ncbi:transmembrane amino acid transporter protein-domain-containing protein [Jimgerdemannia flammicorona]|uniref:Transmembrane amino acid transporter protein-domain-containing protein n=1 Tax=Jimgerdemannia flammicorona TaxID=994334 RepID=A0A433QRW0_9FUNG|nr:transmembrane amino acid transporter protein-domain-containing protein [Jimgerdemannia flammicorona]
MADNISRPSSSYSERSDLPEIHGSSYRTVNADLEADKISTYSSFSEGHVASALPNTTTATTTSVPQRPPPQAASPSTMHGNAAEDDKNDRHSIKSSHAKSTFMQSIFNSVNILIGIGILALPYGLRCAGWVVALSVFVFCCGLTNYSAKLFAKCMDADPSAQTYGDIGAAAFGNQAKVVVKILFLTDLLTASVALVILFSDTVKSLFPDLDMVIIHFGAFLILTPTVFLPIRNLSYASLIGIISAASLVIVIMYDGLSKNERPGSLRDPMVCFRD